MRSIWAMCFLLLCGGCDDEPETATEETGETVAPDETTPANVRPTNQAPSTPANVHLDLLELAHLADVDRDGLFIDFGTQARFKYTSGNWNSGWIADGTRGGVSFSRMGNMGRIYFDVAEPGALHLHLKVRNVGGGPLLAFMNGQTLRENQLERGEFHDVVIEVPAEHVRRGENYLLLRGTETAPIEGESVSFEIAELHVTSASRSTDWTAPRGLRQRVTLGGTERDALEVPQDTSLTWYVDVPDNAELVLGHGASAGSGTLTVRGQVDGGEPIELASRPIGSAWGEERISLSRVASDLARVELKVEGVSAGLSGLRIEAPRDPLPALGSDAAPNATNVVVLCIDTLRASKLRPYNRRSRVRTPALDRFARESVIFERAQTPENWTKPAVASILTSLFPATHGAKNDSSRLPQTALTLGEVYKQHGFTTASFLANGYVSRAFGFDQGWDHYTNYIRERRNTNASNVFGEAAEWVEEHEDEQFFVYIQTIDPHVPYDPPDEFLEMYDPRGDSYTGQVRNRRTHLLLEDAKRRPPRVTFDESDVTRLEALHDGEISYHDQHFDGFVQKLTELGLMEKTIFVVTSDHGEEFNEHGSWGHGHSIFQELLHVPLMVRFPGVGRAGHRVPQVVSTMGIAPTVLEATGHSVPSEFEGRTLMPFVRGSEAPGPWLAFSDFQENRRVLRARDWKLVLRSSLSYVLFDLERDPGEQDEVDARRHPIAMRYLRIHSGQLLGVSNRAGWLTGGRGSSGVQAETADMNLELCQQLVAIGYMDCLEQFPDAI